jgi:hypothetical protein
MEETNKVKLSKGTEQGTTGHKFREYFLNFLRCNTNGEKIILQKALKQK